MLTRFPPLVLAVLLGLITRGLAGPTGGNDSTIELRLIGEQRIPYRLPVKGTLVGGLSGLDYDPDTGAWISESDDKSEFGPGRFYILKLDYDQSSFWNAAVMGVTLLKQPDGRLYPDREHALKGGGIIPDLESVRWDPTDHSVWYTSEGDRPLGMDPFVRHALQDGTFLGELDTPPMFKVHPKDEKGPRHNLSFEGLSFAPDAKSYWVSMEAPLYEDGPLASPARGALARFTHYSRAGKVLGQFAYPVDPIPGPVPPGRLADNGVSEMLLINDHQFLFLERSGVQQSGQVYRFNIRLYEVDITGATDVFLTPSLVGADIHPATKRLVLDFTKLGLPKLDNLEGVSWGHKLENGDRSLLLISDDNFIATQVTQILAFDVASDGGAVPVPGPAKVHRNYDDPFPGVVQDATQIRGFVGEYRWFSNFYPATVTFEGRTYPSAEAAYHASKYPPEKRDAFLALDPDAAKKLSRTWGVDQAWWDARKEGVMRGIIWAKFSQNPDLKAKLLATGDRYLEETNWWGDKEWGAFKGEGKNMLGHLMMEARTKFRAESAAK